MKTLQITLTIVFYDIIRSSPRRPEPSRITITSKAMSRSRCQRFLCPLWTRSGWPFRPTPSSSGTNSTWTRMPSKRTLLIWLLCLILTRKYSTTLVLSWPLRRLQSQMKKGLYQLFPKVSLFKVYGEI